MGRIWASYEVAVIMADLFIKAHFNMVLHSTERKNDNFSIIWYIVMVTSVKLSSNSKWDGK